MGNCMQTKCYNFQKTQNSRNKISHLMKLNTFTKLKPLDIRQRYEGREGGRDRERGRERFII